MTLRIGIVGCGAIADYLHAPAIQACDAWTLTAAADPDFPLAQQMCAKYHGGHSAASLADIAPYVDAVVLATPPHVRVALVREALDLGLHVLCEKPLGNTVAECDEIIALSDACPQIVAVFHQFRFWPNRQQVQQWICDGTIPRQVSVSQGSVYSWNSRSAYTVQQGLVSGGVLINAGTHPLDTLLCWLGDPQEFTYQDDACGGLESNVAMSMRFGRNVPGRFRISRTCLLHNQIRVEFEQETILMTNNDPFHYRRELADGSCEQVACRGADSKHGFKQPAIDLYQDFAEAIRTNGTPAVDAREGTRVIRWVEDCYRQKQQRALPSLAPIPGIVW
jgi:predicted dehydrogenase